MGPAGTVKQAAELIDRVPVDAAILDLNLHGELAFPLIERLMAGGTPCLIVSGYGRDAMPDLLRDVPSIEKPVSCARVVAALEAVLDQAH